MNAEPSTAEPQDAAKPKSALARNTLWMTFGQGARLAIQAAYFTFIARALGVSNYGAFVGVVALVGILYPFASAGRGNLLVQEVSRDRSKFSKMWGAALSVTGTCGLFFIGLVVLLSHFVLPPSIPLMLVVVVALSDIIGLNIITIAGQAFQSFERLGFTAALNVAVSASRLSAVSVLYLFRHSPTPLEWGYAYCASTAVVGLGALILVHTKLGRPTFNLPKSRREIQNGLYFSVSLSAQTIYNDIDKTMLAKLSTLSATGIYGAAYRLIDVSFAPVSALLYAAYPNFFRKGAHGVGASLSYAKPLVFRSIGYACVIAVAILLCAGLVPYVLGQQYRNTAEALRWLSPLPILKAIHYFLSDALAGAGHQGLRCTMQVLVAIFNVLINLWIIPRYAWRGAAWSSIASDALLALSVGACAYYLAHRERSQTSVA